MANFDLLSRRSAGIFAVFLVLACAPVSAQAQTVPTKEEILPPVIAPESQRASVEVRSEGVTDDDNCPLKDYKDISVTIREISFVGPDKAALPAAIAGLLAPIAANPPAGAENVTVICRIRDDASAALRRAGYLASVQIPPQSLENGKLELQVVTAHIVEMQVHGDPGPFRGTLEARIAQLKALDPFNERDAERILLLADDVPGLDVKLSLRRAGTRPGEVIGDLTIDVRRYRLLGNVQNYGSKQLGRYTAYARAEIYGLTGASDLTYFGGQITAQPQEQQVVQAGHVMGLGNSGATLSLAGTYAWSRPDVGTLDLRARSAIVELEVAAPLHRSLRSKLYISAGIDLIEQTTRVYGNGGSSPLNRDRLRTPYVRFSGSTRGLRPGGGTSFVLGGELQLRKGFSILDATLPRTIVDGYTPSRFEGDARAFVARLELSGVVSLGPIFSLAGETQAQWADRPLLNFDEYSIGNFTIGRGYDPGANSGDRAIGTRGELRALVLAKPRAEVELFGFYDSVWLWNLDTGAIENGRRLGSFGGGARFRIPSLLSLDLIYARPEHPALLLPGARRAPDRLLLSLTIQFMPGN